MIYYLDNNATTMVDERVFAEMVPYLRNEYGNPNSVHTVGRSARKAIEKAREEVAQLINADPTQIVFTSGGSEANNLAAYLGVDFNCSAEISAIEHESLTKAVFGLAGMVRYNKPNADGVVDPEDFGKDENVSFVSVMHTNNETGAIQPVEQIAKRLSPSAIFHTDCVQAAGCYDIDVKKIGCDFLSLSSHKIYGPKGAGALYIKNRERYLDGLIRGGEAQEFGLRGGTENVAGIVGFGAACRYLKQELPQISEYTTLMKSMFYEELTFELAKYGMEDKLHINGPSPTSNGKTLNFRIDGIDGETMLLMLDSYGVCLSAGSACRSLEQKPSYVLTAMGLSLEQARNSLRASFSKYNTIHEVTNAARTVALCAADLALVH